MLKLKKPLLAIFFSLLSFGAWADARCQKLSDFADNNYHELDALEIMEVKAQKGTRVYFHNAPSQNCQINQKFIIPNDQVVAYYLIKNEGQEWLYVIYTGKNNIKTTGWVKKKNFKFIKTTAMDG